MQILELYIFTLSSSPIPSWSHSSLLFLSPFHRCISFQSYQWPLCCSIHWWIHILIVPDVSVVSDTDMHFPDTLSSLASGWNTTLLGFLLPYWPLLRILCCFLFIFPSVTAEMTQELDLGPVLFSVYPHSFGNHIQSQGFKYHLWNGKSKFISSVQTSPLVYPLTSLHLTYLPSNILPPFF